MECVKKLYNLFKDQSGGSINIRWDVHLVAEHLSRNDVMVIGALMERSNQCSIVT
jgi:hypothetical protein